MHGLTYLLKRVTNIHQHKYTTITIMCDRFQVQWLFCVGKYSVRKRVSVSRDKDRVIEINKLANGLTGFLFR